RGFCFSCPRASQPIMTWNVASGELGAAACCARTEPAASAVQVPTATATTLAKMASRMPSAIPPLRLGQDNPERSLLEARLGASLCCSKLGPCETDHNKQFDLG